MVNIVQIADSHYLRFFNAICVQFAHSNKKKVHSSCSFENDAVVWKETREIYNRKTSSVTVIALNVYVNAHVCVFICRDIN